MKTIKQQDEYDCGVAAVAMLAGVTYEEARTIVYPTGRSRLTKTKDLHAALSRLGREPQSKRRIGFGSKTLTDLDGDALVFVKMGKNGKGNGHWIVWDNAARKARDPAKTSTKYKIRGYLPV